MASHPRLSLNREAPWAKNAYWMVCVEAEGLTDSMRQALITALRERGIDSRPYFYPVSDMPIYKAADTPITHRFSRIGMNLPSYVDMTEQDVDFVCREFVAALTNIEG